MEARKGILRVINFVTSVSTSSRLLSTLRVKKFSGLNQMFISALRGFELDEITPYLLTNILFYILNIIIQK